LVWFYSILLLWEVIFI